MTYKVEVREELSRTVEIQAKSEAAAIEQAKALYRNSSIVLGAEDYVAPTIFRIIP
jgi:hypothetical protein